METEKTGREKVRDAAEGEESGFLKIKRPG